MLLDLSILEEHLLHSTLVILFNALLLLQILIEVVEELVSPRCLLFVPQACRKDRHDLSFAFALSLFSPVPFIPILGDRATVQKLGNLDGVVVASRHLVFDILIDEALARVHG